MMKLCKACGLEKDVNEFNTHKTKGYQSSCKKCRAAYNREHYRKNKDSYLKSAVQSNERYEEWYRNLKDNKPCTDCKVVYRYYQLSWDHLPEYAKSFDICNARRVYMAREKMIKELEKCELVCHNCHAERSHLRRHRDMV